MHFKTMVCLNEKQTREREEETCALASRKTESIIASLVINPPDFMYMKKNAEGKSERLSKNIEKYTTRDGNQEQEKKKHQAQSCVQRC